MKHIWKQGFGNSQFIEILLDGDEFVLSETHFSFTPRGILIIFLVASIGIILLGYCVVYFGFPYLLYTQKTSVNYLVLITVIAIFLTASETIILIKHKSHLILSNKRLFIYLHPSVGIYPISREVVVGCERTKLFGLLDAVKIKLAKYNGSITLWERTHLTEMEANVNQFLEFSSHPNIAANDSRRILLFERLSFMKRLLYLLPYLVPGLIISLIFTYLIR